ncbi:unnamed protein product [Cuscuta epithymum]|uniref:Protein kinase domain-containing protein n=1 Tax=Cuscuta epithymum TaxID=186058 RepID=A0AAV0EA17_9ASTE|nr:unnamed protein product [Cuscuta epithymum]
MGCVSSKKARSNVSPPREQSLPHRNASGKRSQFGSGKLKFGLGSSREIRVDPENDKLEAPKSSSSSSSSSSSARHSGNSTVSKKELLENQISVSIPAGRLTECEQIAAGWPTWLTSVAGEAVDGWLPLRADMFQRLDKIGQGTYSTVYRARENESGRMVALKKVRFDNFQADSVRFMAREITILRTLDHPNIMKLEGIITSKLSCSIYLVFEYMEHDLAGLLSSPDIRFTESQIKCYMKQLMLGLEHCHSTGVIHRDIKVSNILVNNDGVLKIADFGLANFISAKNIQPLTSRVVTLWYRPPELLLGSTNYGVTVDLWSAGCVFAELFCGRPFLKGRTEVEQLHKIFKLCGSPPEDYWKKSKLSLATVFKPQHPYESTLRERCREFPEAAVDLLETLLAIEPCKRGTASSTLASEYFSSAPYPCDPWSLQKYPPNKEIDAKSREDERRRNAIYATRGYGASKHPRKVRKNLHESINFCRALPMQEMEANIPFSRRNHVGGGSRATKGATVSRVSLKPSYDTKSEVSQATTDLSQAETAVSAPLEMSSSSKGGKNKKQDYAGPRTHTNNANSKGLKCNVLDHLSDGFHTEARSPDMVDKRALRKQRLKSGRQQSFDSSDMYHSRKPSLENDDPQGSTGFLGAFCQQPSRFDTRQDIRPRQTVRRSRFYRDL